jgi:hypothetical protein
MLEGKEALDRLSDGNDEHALLPHCAYVPYTYLRNKAVLIVLL